MPDIEELEHRVTKLEALYEDVLKEKLTAVTARLDRLDARLDQLYEKTERDKTELKTELISRISDVLTKTDKDKRELIYWMVGIAIGFLTLNITAIWAILSFAIKQ